MSYSIGQVLVHPFHGPVTVSSLEVKSGRGRDVEFVHLDAHGSKLHIALPTERAEEVGLRAVMSDEAAIRVFDALQAPSIELPGQWSRRFKEFEARLMTGDLDQLVIVVRELARRGPLAPASGEGRMLKAAVAKVASELALSLEGATVEGMTERVLEAAASVPQSQPLESMLA